MHSGESENTKLFYHIIGYGDKMHLTTPTRLIRTMFLSPQLSAKYADYIPGNPRTNKSIHEPAAGGQDRPAPCGETPPAGLSNLTPVGLLTASR